MIDLSEFASRKLGHCSVDPITLTGLAIGAASSLGTAAASGAFSGGGGGAAPAAPTAPPAQTPPAAAPATAPAGSRGAPKPQQQTFIGAAATPPTQSGQKTLLGQ